MNEERNVIIYFYPYEKIGFNLECEFFTAFMRTIKPPSKEKPPLKFYIDHCIYSKPQFYKLMSRYGRFLYWKETSSCYELHAEVGRKRLQLNMDYNQRKYIQIPFWLINVIKTFKLGFADLILLADIYSFQSESKLYWKSQDLIALFLGVQSSWLSRKIQKLKNLGLVIIKKTSTTNILYVTDKLLDYEHFTR